MSGRLLALFAAATSGILSLAAYAAIVPEKLPGESCDTTLLSSIRAHAKGRCRDTGVFCSYGGANCRGDGATCTITAGKACGGCIGQDTLWGCDGVGDNLCTEKDQPNTCCNQTQFCVTTPPDDQGNTSCACVGPAGPFKRGNTVYCDDGTTTSPPPLG